MKLYFKIVGREHIGRFIESIRHIGEQSSVFFPVELIEQGIGLALSGINNTLATQSNPHWVWPFWLERQSSPRNIDFIPSGVNVVTANLTHRNWTSLGVPDSSMEFMVDPAGMITPHAVGHSILPFLQIEEAIFLPQRVSVHQKREGHFPRIITTYKIHESLQWWSEISALCVEGEELALFENHLYNSGKTAIKVILGLSLRPYNPLTIGHINDLKYKQRLWSVNSKPTLLLMTDPDQVSVSNRQFGDPIWGHRCEGKTKLLSRSGILSGVAFFTRILQPEETYINQSYALIGKKENRQNDRFKVITPAAVAHSRAQFESYFNKNLESGLAIDFGRDDLNCLFTTLKNHIHVFDDDDHFSPGTFFYHSHWIRDSSFIALAYENLGWQSRMSKKIDGLLRLQDRSGFFRSQNGEWDSNGQALFTIINHIKHKGDLKLAEKVFIKLKNGATWIEKMRLKNKSTISPGLLPPGISSEHFGPNDFYFWDNFWSLQGLKDLLWLTQKLNRPEQSLSELIRDYQRALETSMENAMQRLQCRILPSAPHRSPDCSIIGNMVAISPLHIFSADCDWLKNTVDYLFDNYVHDGLFFQPIIHTGYNPYLTMQLARVLLAMGDQRLTSLIDALIRSATATFTWPEAINPRSKGGCMGDGDHGWATAEMLSLLRGLCVYETAEELIINGGCDLQFPHLIVKNASTRYGTLNYELKDGRFTFEITRHPLQDRAPIVLCLPNRARVQFFSDQGSYDFNEHQAIHNEV